MVTPSTSYSLPGVNVSIADFGLRISPPLPGKRLTLIGLTSGTLGGDAQVNEPYSVADVALAVAGLKNADGTHSDLSLAVEQAAAAGADNIEVVISALTSSYATENDHWDALAASYAALRSHPMDLVHPVAVYVDDTSLSGTDPYSDDRTIGYGRQLANFCYRASVVGNSVQGVIGLKPLMKLARDEGWAGAPATDAAELFDKPSLAFVNEWSPHVRVINNAATGLKDHSSETELVGFISGSLEESAGVISTNYTWYAQDETPATAVDHLGQNIDGGRAVVVFGSVSRQISDSIPELAATYNKAGNISINTNGAVAYAALLSQLEADESPTGKTIPSLIAARDIPESFAIDMLNNRVATMVNKTTGYVVSKGITAAHNAGSFTRSDFVNWTTYSIVLAAIDLCKLAAEPFIGKQSSPAVLNAMKVAITQNLQVLKDRQAVGRATPTIVQTQDQAILGNLDVILDIAIYGEISTINVRAALSRL